ncbi:MAG: cytochrome P450 [Actinophytocola sp.]|uniref:cytochrome P450 n=1 Tax=Actinophytocola sp. TaxID=1872138 RepID=UPI001329F295|nr:cytochrome P450 [Actinophytocola sp.]MPZ83053.1 cytochrome P450 [Actinophytocola sp.]
MTVPEIDLADPALLSDPFTVYGRVREASPLASIPIPGIGAMWALTRHDNARAMLADPRFEINAASFLRPEVPEDCLPYMRTMSEMDGPDHARLRKLVAPAFTPRRAERFRPRIQPLVDALLDDLPAGDVDLLEHFARPLPIDVICELVGIPRADRPGWRESGGTVARGSGPDFAAAIPVIIAGAKDAVARHRADPGDDLLDDLIRVQAEDGDRLSDTELVTLVWHLVIAGQTPANLIANAVALLLAEPRHVAAFHAAPGRAVEELIRWCGPAMMSIPRYAREDVELCGARVRKGEPVTAVVASVNRDPRAFTDPDELDLGRSAAPSGHLGFGHGPHFCLGASLARVQTEVALITLLRRFPGLSLVDAERAPDPGTWRLATLRVTR